MLQTFAQRRQKAHNVRLSLYQKLHPRENSCCVRHLSSKSCWRTWPNLNTRDGSPPATASWALYSACPLYMKFHSTISVTFSEEKRGGSGESTLSCLACWRPPESHDRQSCVHFYPKMAYDTRVDSLMLVQNSWFDTSTDNVTLAHS